MLEKLANNPAHKAHRQEHRHHGQRGGQHRQADFFGAVHRRLVMPLAHARMADDVLPHHDGVVDQQANRQGQRQQGHHIQGKARHGDGEQRANQRNRQGQPGDHRAAPRGQKHKHDQHGQRRAFQQGHLDVGQRVFHLAGLIFNDGQRHAGGQIFAQLVQRGVHPGRGVHHIGAARALDFDGQRALAVDQRQRVVFFLAVQHLGDVVQPDRRAIAHADGDLAKRLGRGQLAGQAHRIIAVDVLHPTGRKILIGVAQGVDHFGGVQPQRLHAIGVDMHAQLALDAAHQLHFAHAGHGLQALAHHLVGVGGQRARAGAGRGDNHRHHRVVVGVDLIDRRHADFAAKAPLHASHFVAHILHRAVGVDGEHKLDHHH